MSFDVLADLLDPVSPEAFFDRTWERAPLHLPAAARTRPARPPLLDRAALLDALGTCGGQAAGVMLFPEHWDDRWGPADLLADPGLLRAYLDAGHPVAWNRPRGLFPAVDALAAALAEAFGAHVWPNVYATGTAGTPFGMHFDCHEVIAVHCEGEKDWTISEVRIDRPLDAAAMEPTVRAVMRARCDEAASRPLLCLTTRPGDVLYLPRGQFHLAEARGGPSLHVTFGVRLLSGHDVALLLADRALADPALREYLPPAAADPGGQRARDQLVEIYARLAALLDGPLGDELAEARAHAVARSGAGRSGGR